MADLMECDLCFCLIRPERTVDHAYWHRIAASPMAHGMYLAAKEREVAEREARDGGADAGL